VTALRDAETSALDNLPPACVGQPYLEQTLTLLRSVRDHDYDALADLCDDDFGIVDGDPTGAISVIRTRAEWEQWFTGLFATLDVMGAHTDSEVLRYDAARLGRRRRHPAGVASRLTSACTQAPARCSSRAPGGVRDDRP
jgi:hypothetical protein